MRVRFAAALALALAMFAPTVTLTAQTAMKKNAPPLKGPIEVGYDMSAKRDGDKIVKEYLGKTQRRTFFCNTCQILYE